MKITPESISHCFKGNPITNLEEKSSLSKYIETCQLIKDISRISSLRNLLESFYSLVLIESVLNS